MVRALPTSICRLAVRLSRLRAVMPIVRIAWHWLHVAGATVVVVAAGWLCTGYLLQLTLLNVQTGSMQPAFAPNDLLVTQRVHADDIRVGDIVSYRSSRNPNELVTHRVVHIFAGRHSLQTKGDALNVTDPTIKDSLVVGRAVAVVSGLGKLLTWVHSWWGLAVCVYLPVGLITVHELWRLERSIFRSRLYQLHQKLVV
jgi:signal peptidase I